VLAIALGATADAGAADPRAAAWAALAQGGHVALIRHGNAPPGHGGDPPGFKLEDCATQRNLDARGREQASALGKAFREHGVPVDRVMASPWCRCVDTARLMAVGDVEPSWALVPDTGSSWPRLTRLIGHARGPAGPGTLVLVTHALKVQPLTGFLPNQAESVVLKPTADGGFDLVGRIPTSILPPPAPRR